MGDQDGGRQTKAFAGGLDLLGSAADARGLGSDVLGPASDAVASPGAQPEAHPGCERMTDAIYLRASATFEAEELRIQDSDLPAARGITFGRDADEWDRQTYAIIGAAMEVHRELGPGFLESVYGDALALELRTRSIPFAREVPCPVHYKKQRLDSRFTADFLCHGNIILELKATRGLTDSDTAQALNYLKATGLRRALLLNFGGASLQHRRLVLDASRPIELPDFSA